MRKGEGGDDRVGAGSLLGGALCLGGVEDGYGDGGGLGTQGGYGGGDLMGVERGGGDYDSGGYVFGGQYGRGGDGKGDALGGSCSEEGTDENGEEED